MNASQRGAWERLGQDNPYYGVLTSALYRGRVLAGENREQFFRSGEDDLRVMLGLVQRHLRKQRRFHRALEFGCGVGRMTLPLAAYADRVVGVDVSAAMCAEGARNRDAAGIKNLVFTLPEHGLDTDLPPYDLIYSYNVFQHIPVDEGLRYLERLLDCLKPGGVAALHFTCVDPRPAWQARGTRLLRSIPLVRNVMNWINGEGFTGSAMQMYAYPFEQIMPRLQAHGVRELACDLSDHAGWRGVVLCFVKPLYSPQVAGGLQVEEGEDQQPQQQTDAGRGE